jgi:predicted ferric reductase
VDLFYTTTGDAPFVDEISSIASRHKSLRAHVIDTSVEGRLTTERVLAVAGGDPTGLTVFMCGPPTMLRSFQTDFRRRGVLSKHIHREYFDWR